GVIRRPRTPARSAGTSAKDRRRRSRLVVGGRREFEELFQGLDALVVHLGRKLDADVTVMPGFERVAGDPGQAVRVAHDEAEAVCVLGQPGALRRGGETLLENATIARADVGGQPRLVLTVTGAGAGEIGSLLTQSADVVVVGAHLGVVRPVGA